jgi:hypothetical protein
MRKVIGVALVCFFVPAFGVQVHQVARDGRQIQLDGFLLEWKKSDAMPLGNDSSWSWDVINTREGLTGYFKSEKLPGCKDGWTFRFLPCRLSPYQSMEISTEPAGREGRFYRVAKSDNRHGAEISCEWILPWASVCHDSSGAFQVGLFAFDSCGDTLQPLILAGHVYNPKKVSWGGVYGKTILLGVLLIMLFFLQKSTRGKFRIRKIK